MDWTDEHHTLQLTYLLPNGQSGDVHRGDEMQVSIDTNGLALPTWRSWWAPLTDVSAFALTCHCIPLTTPTSTGAATTTPITTSVAPTKRTVLARWQRTPDPASEDLHAGYVYTASDQDVTTLINRPDIAAHLQQLWDQHRAPQHAATAITTAHRQARQALTALDQAVAAGRDVGLSWADIARASGITRQSARERWGPTPPPRTRTQPVRDPHTQTPPPDPHPGP